MARRKVSPVIGKRGIPPIETLQFTPYIPSPLGSLIKLLERLANDEQISMGVAESPRLGRDISQEALAQMFNAQPNPEQAYNDARDLAEMNQDQELENALAKLSKTRPTKFKKTSAKTGYGSGRFQSQFGQDMGFNFSQISKPKRKRSAKMKASDKKLSKAFKKANLICRKKNGQFKKGKSQKDVAKCAHRLRKKM